MQKSVAIQLDSESQQPLYLQVFESLKKQIEEGRLEEHVKLPPIRKMAGELGVNNSTIVNAYRKLELHHLAYSKTGSGTYVASRNVQERTDERSAYSIEVPSAVEKSSAIIDFTGVSPSPDYFPVSSFRALADQVLERDGGYAFESLDSQGYPPLRETLVHWLKRRNIVGSSCNIHITSGSQQSLDIITKALVNPNDVVAVESPVYQGALATFSSRGAKILEVPLLADGIDLNRLEERVRRTPIRFLYTMPSFQNPTGISWTLRKKQQLLVMAEKYGFYIVEDDFLSEFSYGRKNLQTLRELDSNDRVIYVKSIAKVLMPGLRLGFMLTPADLTETIRASKYLSDIATSGLSQRVVDLYLNSTVWDVEFKDMVRGCRIRYNLMVEQIQKNFPDGATYLPPQGGFCFWFTLPEGRTTEALARKALQSGIRLQPGHTFFLNQKPNKHFRLGFGNVENNAILRAMPVLGQIIRNHL